MQSQSGALHSLSRLGNRGEVEALLCGVAATHGRVHGADTARTLPTGGMLRNAEERDVQYVSLLY